MTTGFDLTRLEALLESAQLLQSSLELKPILKHLLRTVMGRLPALRGMIAVCRREGGSRVELVRGAAALTEGSVFHEDSARQAGMVLFFPIGSPSEPVGVLGVGGLPSAVKPEEAEFIEALLGLAASVISNAQAHEQAHIANRLLDQRLQELRALLDLGRGLAAAFDPEEVARLVGYTLAGRWAISRYTVAAWKENHPSVLRQKGMTPGDWPALQEKYGACVEARLTPEGGLVLPIRSRESPIGLLVCGPRMPGVDYGEADLEFGAGLAAQAAVAFEKAWHLQDMLARQQLEKELELAAGIQRDLFPSSLPSLAGWDVAARNRQARQVGGDYYDVLPFAGTGPEDPHLLCVADISGKGIAAALLMSTLQATLRSLLRRESSLVELASITNELLYATTPANKYSTAFLCAVQPRTGECRYVNCAHNAALLLRAGGEVELLDGPGFALGLFPMRTHQEREFAMQPGDILALYSDGVIEAQNPSDEQFEIERMKSCLRENAGGTAAEIVDRLFEAIDAFAAGAPQYDDITLMIVKRND